MAKTGATGITRIIKAGKYSMQGLRAAFVNEAAFRQESILAVIMIAAAVFLSRDVNGFNPLCFTALISGPFLVMIAEIINSALEAVVDRIGDEYHELSGRAWGNIASTISFQPYRSKNFFKKICDRKPKLSGRTFQSQTACLLSVFAHVFILPRNIPLHPIRVGLLLAS